MMDHMEVFQTLGQNMRVLYDEPMADHTTFRVGGPADLMVIPENVEQLRQAIRLCRDASIPWYVIGNGSNLLVSDKGYRGVVIKICRNMDLIEKEEKYVVKNLRLDADLVERGSAISQKKGISFNKFVNLALEFALDRFEEE